MFIIGLVVLHLLTSASQLYCSPHHHHQHRSQDQYKSSNSVSRPIARQDDSDMLLDDTNSDGSSVDGDTIGGLSSLIDWSSPSKLLLSPSVKQSFSQDLFGLFKQKEKQSSSTGGRLTLEDLDSSSENWVKAYTGPGIGGIALHSSGDFDEHAYIDGAEQYQVNDHGSNKKGKGKKSKAWWAKFFDRQRSHTDHPSDPVNYGINPHGRYPSDGVEIKPQTNSEADSDDRPPILNNMRKWFTRFWRPNGDNYSGPNQSSDN